MQRQIDGGSVGRTMAKRALAAGAVCWLSGGFNMQVMR